MIDRLGGRMAGWVASWVIGCVAGYRCTRKGAARSLECSVVGQSINDWWK